MTRTIEHDGAASLRVEQLASAGGRNSRRDRRSGWYVVRTCTCHAGQTITVPFGNRERAERALRVLDDDAKRYA